MHTLHKLRYLFLRHDSGYILHRGIGQLHPHGIVGRYIVFGKMLRKSGGISIRCAFAVMELVGKVNHATLEYIQRISKL